MSPALAVPPRVFLLSAEKLDAARTAVAAGDPAITARLDQWLRDEVNEVFTWDPLPSVTNNAYVSPGGTKNDYVSFGPYWWPNPDTADGLPFVRRDGHVNHAQYTPEKGHDRTDLKRMIQAVKMLALASYLTNDARYAVQVKRIIRCWFLDASTKMNPHLEYGQAIPGRTGGRKEGIIDTAELAEVVDALRLLESRDDWNADVRDGTVQWFRDYLNWLRKSQHGKGERLTANNHATWYDVQVVMFALYVGETTVARDALGDSRRRLDTQIEGDGRQPQELARTRPFAYSCGNLAGFMRLANLGETLDIDLWHVTGQQGGTIRAAFDFLRPYASGKTPWTYPDLDFTPSKLTPAIWLMGDRFDGAYAADRPESKTITWEEFFR